MSDKSASSVLTHLLAPFRSVAFGITLMVLTALYIAIGSGLPHVREVFEMNELQFFNAWPLKTLMVLLIVNLSVVTWTRIPLTPPRYGVWCIHAGIITLILGTAFYYHNKIEGMTRIPVGRTADFFYDAGMRALYARAGIDLTYPYALPDLPRFKKQIDPDGFSRSLHGIEPVFLSQDEATGKTRSETLAAQLGLKDLKIDITGYWPYAQVKTDFMEATDGGETAIAVKFADPNAGASAHTLWLVATDPAARQFDLGGVEMEHRNAANAEQLAALRRAAAQIHRIDASVGGFKQSMFVEIGKTYTLGNTGYHFTVENFNPAFPMSGTGEMVQAMTVHVTSAAPAPAREFRRMILGGKTLQTDFLLNAAGAGPMGKRQKEPLDKDLSLLYTLNDSQQLLPMQGGEKHTLVTSPAPGIVEIATGTSRATAINDLPNTGGEVAVSPGEAEAPFAGGAQSPHAHNAISLRVDRKDHVRRDERVVEVPSALRDRDTGQAGLFQVLRVNVKSGDWSQEAYVPFSQYAAEEEWGEAPVQDGNTIARSTPIMIPGANAPLTLRLGQKYEILPARLTLDRFDAVAYDGLGKSGSSLMRDFCSTLTIEDRETHEKTTDVAHMNHPVYFGGGSWLFFQAQWDPQGGRWTVLGIGNRPGVGVMVLGCVMIIVGLLYAFYAKPFVLRRMKQKALAEAAAKKQRAVERTPSGAGV